LPDIDTIAMVLPKEILFSFSPLGDRNALSGEWRELEERADPSFFLTWSWIGAWLATLPPDIEPVLARGSRYGETVALGLLVAPTQRPWRFWKPRACWLHETGRPELDTIFIEYNGWLAAREHAQSVPAIAIRQLGERSDLCSEIRLGGIAADYLETLRDHQPYRVTQSMPSFHVDLREPGIADLGRFGKNTRQQIRRALRDYAGLGTIEVAAARDAAEALLYLDELKVLHQEYWRGRGRPGAFAAPYFEIFHRTLIAERFGRGEVELLRIHAGTRVVGLLYNFVYRRRVYSYQSGFSYALLPRGRPGLLCHWLAIERHRTAGAAIYDFLAGDNRLKRSLSNAQTEMNWIVTRTAPARRGQLGWRLFARNWDL
jgi:CelD/BcsL family acetyltransferase involved in cellulose biosynthesis